ncbi:MAG: YfhO family protein [Lachnospiraceae bacterium]|nr:YfhO family protein [Lachnospiraceae bacterium]
MADSIDDYRYGRTLLTYGVILVFLVVVLPFVKRLGKKECLFIAKIALFVVVVWSVHVNWKAIARDRDVQAVRQYDIVDELITEDDGYYRVDYKKMFSEPKLGMNISLRLDYMGITEYFSIINRNYMKAFPEWEAYEETFNNGGLDQRTILETAAAVKYFIAREENDFIVPYGFESEL